MNTVFFEFLKKKEKEETSETILSSTVRKVVKQIEPILGRIPAIFEEYTLHDISHSVNVINNMWKLIPADVKEQLNALEIYFLILSAYLHDVGMAVSKNEEDVILKNENFLKFRDKHVREINAIEKYKEENNIRAVEFYEKRIFMDYIRKYHHKRSYDYIMKNYSGEKGLKIDNENHARIIARICKAHCLDVSCLEDKSEFDRKYSIEGQFINLQFLSVCLRLGDILDADSRRAPKILKEFIDPRDPTSMMEWEKHLSVPQVGITEEKIKINATCKSPKYERGLREFIGEVKKEKKDLTGLLKDNPSEISERYYLNLKDIEINIETDGTYIYNDFKFSLDNEKIFDLLMGTSLYNEKTVALRELLQNSIDACRCRKAKEAGYEGKISFKLVKNNKDEGKRRKIIVEDNGIGMDDQVIENYFMQVGKSYYQSRDFRKEDIRFSPISVFGIGILYCFMIADQIEVETLKEGRDPRKLDIDSYSEYFVTRRGSRTEPGTKITISLKDDVEFDLIEELKNYARHIEFPVHIDDGENTEIIVDSGYDFNFVDFMNPLYKQYVSELNPYFIDFEKEGIEGVKGTIVFIFLKDENDNYGFKSKNLVLSKYKDEKIFEKSPYRFDNEGQCFLSQDGILIEEISRHGQSENILPMWIDNFFIFFDINLEDEAKIDLTLDRSNIVVNDKLSSLRAKIELVILKHIEKFFSNKYLVTNKSKNIFMEHFFRAFTDMFYERILSEIFLKRIKKLLFFECSVNGKLKYLRYKELKDRYGRFYVIREKNLFRGFTSEEVEILVEKTYPEDPIIYTEHGENLTQLLLIFIGEHTIVTNKELGFSFDKYLTLPSKKKQNSKKEEHAFTYEGDYKKCFGSLTTGSFEIEPNINHPFVRLMSKNKNKFKGEDKKKHELFISKLISMNTLSNYLMPLICIQEMQKHLLDLYVEKQIISKEEAELYILTEKDFCPYDMGEYFYVSRVKSQGRVAQTQLNVISNIKGHCELFSLPFLCDAISAYSLQLRYLVLPQEIASHG